jgi:hypothetical protein
MPAPLVKTPLPPPEPPDNPFLALELYAPPPPPPIAEDNVLIEEVLPFVPAAFELAAAPAPPDPIVTVYAVPIVNIPLVKITPPAPPPPP